ncbi:DUF3109 domain-containing protein [Sphingobacteriales bacterium UPWRP_1]|nr:hypothetical protein BVG80_00820 [Sphingobacteriales bacterium TSM_CSM]PSJ72426.1 DUF3109 domain-containing protein [Sphingobacteriales bacterium UPWRP_1]
MLIIDNTIISNEVIEEQFVCNLTACKGACCVEGDTGAILEAEELSILDQIYPLVAPYLTPEGRAAIEQQGRYVYDPEIGHTTTLINGAACAYVIFDDMGIAKCGIQKAFEEGVVDFPKPISCHLYPIRTKRFNSQYEAVNYERWNICKPACRLGKQLKVPVYAFLKEPLIRKYGLAFYQQLEAAALHLKETDNEDKNG